MCVVNCKKVYFKSPMLKLGIKALHMKVHYIIYFYCFCLISIEDTYTKHEDFDGSEMSVHIMDTCDKVCILVFLRIRQHFKRRHVHSGFQS